MPAANSWQGPKWMWSKEVVFALVSAAALPSCKWTGAWSTAAQAPSWLLCCALGRFLLLPERLQVSSPQSSHAPHSPKCTDKKQLIPQQIHTQHSIINCIVPDWSFQCVGYQQRILYITSDHFPSHNLWVVRLTMDILWFIIYLTGFVSCWQSVTIKKYLALLLSSYISGQELSKKLRHFLWVFMVPSGLFYLMWWPCDLSPYCHYYNNRSYNWHVCGVN